MTKAEAYAQLNISIDLIPPGSSNRPGKQLQATYVTIHNTDNEEKGADARAHASYLKGSDARKRQVSWHFTVDDSRAIKHLPLSEQGWHAGTSKGNQVSLGIEICENKGIDHAKATDRAALLAALLIHELGLSLDHVVPHNFWSGKKCPHRLLDKLPNGTYKLKASFVKAVETYLTGFSAAPTGRAGTSTSVASSKDSAGLSRLTEELRSAGALVTAESQTQIVLPAGPSYVLNARPDVPDFRDQAFVSSLVKVPTEMPLAKYLAHKVPILDQGQEGACTGFGLATVANFLLRQRDSSTKVEVSPRMLYDMARRYDEWAGEDYGGSSARGAMKGWNKHGVCSLAAWPYFASEGNGTLTSARALDAAANPLGAYFRVNHKDIVAMHTAIAEVGILYATSQVHEGWQSVGKDGIISFSPTVIGGHAFAIVGYDSKGFWIQNSWAKGWGKDGFGHISYDDWLENGTDVWVARLGVPISFTKSGGPVIASNYMSGEFKPATFAGLRGHVVCLDNDGLLAQTGEFANNAETIREIIEGIPEKTKGWTKTRILLYAHGGLVDEAGFLGLLATYRETMMDKQVYPLCFVWRTSLLDTIRNILQDALHVRMPDEGVLGWLDERKDDLLEVITAVPGRLCWSQMKGNAIQATCSRDGGARLVATLIQELLGDDVEIHIAGHSAGSILMAPLAQLLATKGQIRTGPMQSGTDAASKLIPEIGYGRTIESCTLWAPAIRTDLFEASIAPLVRNRQIKRLAIYGLTDKAERDDNCVGVYGKSLLYLVSHAFESARNTPLLGMEKFQTGVFDGLPRTDVIKAKYDANYEFKPGSVIPNTASQSRHHGDFDDDPATLWSTLARILDQDGCVI